MRLHCHQSTVRGECDRCGRTTQALHMSEEIHGWYCANCCPICSQADARHKRGKFTRPKDAERAA